MVSLDSNACFVTARILLLVLCVRADSGDTGTRKVGGPKTNKGTYPWQISVCHVQPGPNDETDHMCGGSIINERWIVTATHCFEGDKDPDNYFIVAGEHNTKQEEDVEQRRNVHKIILHEDYEFDSGQNDIGLLKLTGDLNFNKYIRPVRVAAPPENNLIEGNSQLYCVTSGWGKLKFEGSEDDGLQTVDIPQWPLEVCKFVHSGETKISEDMLCTGFVFEGINSCQGDSGGPLVCKLEGKWTLVGVTSIGQACGVPGYPVIYTRVTHFYDWISSVVTKH